MRGHTVIAVCVSANCLHEVGRDKAKHGVFRCSCWKDK